MPNMRPAPTGAPIAILVSDLHLSHDPPKARRGEKSWYQAQGCVLEKLRQAEVDYACPIICAGDVFHHWNQPPELISWAIRNVPSMFAIPGQHDLPFHRLDLQHRSAYQCLVDAGILRDLDGPTPIHKSIKNPIWVHPYPWGVGDASLPKEYKKAINIAVFHRYAYKDQTTCYPGAPEDGLLKNIVQNNPGFDVYHFGDNHTPWLQFWDNRSIGAVNTGCAIRRKTDEVGTPSAAIVLYSSLEISTIDLTDPADVIETTTNASKGEGHHTEQMVELLRTLRAGTAKQLNFVDVLLRHINKEDVPENVRNIILEALDAPED